MASDASVPSRWLRLEDDSDFTISGYPICPACETERLHLRSMPGDGETYWYCTVCGDWKTSELISILKQQEENNG